MAASARHQFLEDYRTIRSAEGRGSREPAYYLALPYRDLSGKNAAQWAIRGKSYRYFERKILSQIERKSGRPLDVLDLGAGNCWMSYRLSLRHHRLIGAGYFYGCDGWFGSGAALRPARSDCSKRSLISYPCATRVSILQFSTLPFITRPIIGER